jgi:hypothetical protein
MNNTGQPDNLEVKAVPRGSTAFWRELRRDLFWILSIFLIGTGAKLWLILTSSNCLPFIDQWNGEAANLYVPFLGGHYDPRNLFSGHNEHRILFTRLYDLALLLLNGQWDSQLQMVLNAMIHAGALAGLGCLLARLLGRQFWPALWLLLVVVLVLPFGWENTLAGFQSQFYFLLVFTLLAIWFWGAYEPFTWRWTFGVAAAVAAVFTVASGLLTALTIGAFVVLDALKQRRAGWVTALNLALAAGIFIIAAAFTPDVPISHEMRAHTAHDLLLSFGNNLAWPWIILPPFAALTWLPLVLLAWIYFKSERPLPAERLILGIGAWVALQSLAIAYARGAGGRPPYWRYMDFLSLMTVASGLSMCLLLTRYRRQLPFPRICGGLFAIWLIGTAAGLWLLTDRALHVDIPERVLDQRKQYKTTREFLATDDENVFKNKPDAAVPYLDVDVLVGVLRNPDIRRVFPACLRDPLPVTPKPGADAAFVPHGAHLAAPDSIPEPCWGNWTGAGPHAIGTFESLPVRKSAFPFLEIPVAGDLGEPGVLLSMFDLNNGKLTRVKPVRPPGGRWQNVLVKAPSGDFMLKAQNDDAGKWFAFEQPREVGRLSAWAMEMLGAWRFFIIAGLGCLFFGLLQWSEKQPSD